MSKRVTLQDLARAANVSVSTASRVMSGKVTVDRAIRRRLHEAAEKLGFDIEERRKSKSKTVAFLLANRDLLHSYHARVLLGAEIYCSSCNWDLLFMSARYSPDTPPDALHLPRLLGSRSSAQAVILAGSHSPNLFEALQQRGMPFAVLGNNVMGECPKDSDVAYSDDINGAYAATRHLIAQGHRLIGFAGNLRLPWSERCFNGYSHAMSEAGLAPICADIRSDGTQLGFLATKSLSTRTPLPTAILADSDQVAAGVYSALEEIGLSVPNDVSVVGFNDTLGALFSPKLTTVREFPEEMGRHLAEFVLNRLKKPDSPPQNVIIPTQLIIRDSVAAPPSEERAKVASASLESLQTLGG